ncbi:MAG: NADH-quinone oxidoreductase subunit C [Betaproteobacteria bacterium]|nr:NADH-quinone oxidoreductase subunit C [Betaproteobacteria bacterium]
MRIEDLPIEAEPVPGAVPAWHAVVPAGQLRDLCSRVKEKGGRLVALWGSDETDRGEGYALHVALVIRSGLVCFTVPLAHDHPRYPGVADIFPAADRMQRATYDLLGMHARGNPDHRKWLRHGAWPAGVFPLRKGYDPGAVHSRVEDRYPFVRVEGEGVHEIPVGPVHAGTIEPGHFRFSIVGEFILRLEERLGYTHKGVEKLAETMTLAEGARLAGRVSGDSTVAYAWAYAQAVESVTGTEPPAPAVWLRAILLELERIHNHLGDLGYLGNDVALAFGFFQFWRLKEQVLRLNQELFGHRYLMDVIVPGGVARDMPLAGIEKLLDLASHLEREVATLRGIYDEHAGAQDRFIGAGRVAPSLAAELGLTGLAGRASGLAWDLRVEYPVPPYDGLEVRMATHRNSDVAARVSVRFDEVLESLRLIRALLRALPAGDLVVPLGGARPGSFGVGWVEGWRGEVLIGLHVGEQNRIRRMHPHDPSWQNWPILERAVIGNIVPDFPLINKSFNLSYSGQDL